MNEQRWFALLLSCAACVFGRIGADFFFRGWSAWLDLYQCRRDTLDKESVWDEGRSTSLSRW